MATKATRPRSAHATSEKILEAARDLFVERGFSGTSMGQIAAKAGVNHSLLFHHFGNKQKLWQEVKQAVIFEAQSAYSNIPPLDQPLDSFLKELIARAILFYKNNPDIVRMLNWQRLESTTERAIGITVSHESKRWLEACLHYQKKGELDPNLKPEFVITLVFSIVGSIAMDPNVFIEDPENNKLYIEFCASCLYRALENSARS